MHSYVIDGVVYTCPMYVVRAGPAWQVRMPGTKSAYFADSVFGSIERSHEVALNARESAAPVTRLQRPLAERERAGKTIPTGIPGVIFCVKHRAGKRREHQLRVQMPDRSFRTIYVGTDATWQKNFEKKIELARAIRADNVSAEMHPVSMSST